MKVVIQCNYDPETEGGIAVVTRALVEVLKLMPVTLTIISGANREITTKRGSYLFRGYRILRKISGAPVLLFGNLRFILNSVRAQLIVFQEPYPTLLPAIFFLRFVLQKRVIVLVHAIPQIPQMIAGPYDQIRRLLLSHCHVVATSPVLLAQLHLERKGLSQVVPLFFDASGAVAAGTLSRVEALDLANIPPRYMLSFGRLAAYKGLPVLLTAILRLPHVSFVIAGSGQDAGLVVRAIAKHKLENVLFINRRMSEAEKFHLMNHSAAFLLPSINTSEAFAITQLEAMYFARPIINTNLENGVNYVAPSGIAARTVPPGDAAALAEAIANLWEDPDAAYALGQGGKQRVEALFAKDAFDNAWRGIFEDYCYTDG